jgi:Ca2+-binding EF-hand superfamily protein
MAMKGSMFTPSKSKVPDPAKIPDFKEKDLQEMKEAFDIFDKKGNGIIQIGEMIEALAVLKVDEKYRSIFNLFKRLEDEFPKGVTFKEFMEHLQFMFGNIENGPGLTRFFEMLDIENKKYLDKERLGEIALEVGEHLTEQEIEELIEYDFNVTDGKVDVDSFYLMMIKSAF